MTSCEANAQCAFEQNFTFARLPFGVGGANGKPVRRLADLTDQLESVGVDRSITRFHSPCRGAEAPPQSTCRSSISAKVGRDLPLSQEDSSRCRVKGALAVGALFAGG